MKTIQENLKLFYVGLKDKEPFFYKNKDLTTHAAIIGMTGSGKMGLGIGILEEACIDNIPTFVIDPKGDMTNLALAFPQMRAQDFAPYIDENKAQNKGMSADEFATSEAQRRRGGGSVRAGRPSARTRQISTRFLWSWPASTRS